MVIFYESTGFFECLMLEVHVERGQKAILAASFILKSCYLPSFSLMSRHQEHSVPPKLRHYCRLITLEYPFFANDL
jgi:hypothetical protein